MIDRLMKRSKCPNIGGLFEWVDLVKAGDLTGQHSDTE